jgi:hypothetical protein
MRECMQLDVCSNHCDSDNDYQNRQIECVLCFRIRASSFCSQQFSFSAHAIENVASFKRRSSGLAGKTILEGSQHRPSTEIIHKQLSVDPYRGQEKNWIKCDRGNTSVHTHQDLHPYLDSSNDHRDSRILPMHPKSFFVRCSFITR